MRKWDVCGLRIDVGQLFGVVLILAVAVCGMVVQGKSEERKPALYLLTDSSRLAYQQGDIMELNVVVKTPNELSIEKLNITFQSDDSDVVISAGGPGRIQAGCHTFSYSVDTRYLKPDEYRMRAEAPPIGSAEKRIFIAPGTPKTNFKIALYANNPHIEKATQWKQMSEQYRFNLYWPYINVHVFPKPIELKEYQAGLKDPLLPPHEPFSEEVGIESSPNLSPQWGFDLATRCGIDMYPGGLGQHQPLQNVNASWADEAVRELSRHYTTFNAQRFRRYSSFKGLRPLDEAGLTWWPKKEGGQNMTLYPHPAQAYLYKKLYGVDPPSQGTAYKEKPDEWLRWITFRTRLFYDLYEGIRKSIKSVNPDFSLHSGNYAPDLLTDTYPPTQGYAMDVISSHGYSDPLTCWYYYDMQRMDNWEKPSWFMPVWWPDFDHSLVRALVGSTLIGGTDGVGWGVEEDFGFNHSPHGATDQYVLGEVQRINRFLEENGDFISILERQPSPVAILYSLTEGAFNIGGDFDFWLDPILWIQGYSGRIKHAWMTSVLAGYPPDPICEEEVLKGRLTRHKILLLVHQQHITPSVQKKVEEFIKSGGTVFLDGESTVKIPGAKTIPVKFTDIYQLQRDLTEKAKKEGRPDSYYWRASYLDPNYNEPVAKALASAYKTVTDPPVILSRPRIAWRIHKSGDGIYLIGLNAEEAGGDFRWEYGYHSVAFQGEVGLPSGTGPVYDLIDGKMLPVTEREGKRWTTVSMRAGDFRILSLFPERITGLNIKVPKKISQGEEIPVRVEILGEKSSRLNVALPLKVSIIDPEGNERYNIFRTTKGGIYQESFLIAANDLPGRWIVRVWEPLEGKSVDAYVQVQGRITGLVTQEELIPVFDEEPIRDMLTSKSYPLWIVIGNKDQQTLAESLKASLGKHSISCEIKLVDEIRKEDPSPVIQIPNLVILDWKRSLFPPSYLNIPANLILLGDIVSNSLIREIQDAGLIGQPITPELPGRGRAYIEYCWSPFEVEKDAVLVLASDNEGLSAGINRLSELVVEQTLKAKAYFKTQVKFTGVPKTTNIEIQPFSDITLSNEPIRSLSASDDGLFLAVGSYDGSVTLLNENGEKLWSKFLPNPIHKVRIDKKGDRVVAASWPSLVVFDRKGNELWKITRSSTEPLYSYLSDFHVLDINPADGAVAAGTLDDVLLLADKSGKELWRKGNRTGGQSHVWSVAISEITGQIVVGDENEVAGYDKSGNKVWTSGLARARSLAISNDGTIYAGGLSRALVCIEKESKEKWRLSTPGYVMALCIDEKNGLVVAGISNGEILGIDRTNGKILWKASSSVSDRGVARAIECLTADPVKGCIAAGTQGGEVIILSSKGQLLKQWKGEDEWITDVAFLANNRLAISTWSGRIEFFEPL